MAVGTTNPEAVSSLMARFRQGDPSAAGQLVEKLYPELRRLAVQRMRRERSDHTWRPTELVNELYLELLKIRAFPGSEATESGREAFLGFAVFLMKRILIHHARPLARRVEMVDIEDAREIAGARASAMESLAEIDSLMNRLAAVDPKLRLVVELKVFGGMTGAEIAEQLECGTATVARCWSFAQQWLKQELG
jgi:RNA polymerase sigma factor (TIGR02999 family)